MPLPRSKEASNIEKDLIAAQGLLNDVDPIRSHTNRFLNQIPPYREFPSDETIAQIINCTDSNRASHLAVPTDSGAGRKIRVFDVIGGGDPEIAEKSDDVFSGTGVAHTMLCCGSTDSRI